MSVVKQIDDEVRLNILQALLKKGSVSANIKQIQKITGYHKATIKSSLDFLQQSRALTGYGPKINFRKLGHKLEVIVMLQVDMTEKKLFQKFLDEMKKDPNLYRLSSIVGAGNWNLMARHIYKDVESYHIESQKKYFEKIPGIYKLIRDQLIFYGTEPHYKNASRTSSVIDIIRKQKGYSE